MNRLRRTTDRLVLIAALSLVQAVLVTAFAFDIAASKNGPNISREMPALCQEDEIITGEGDYVGGKGWDRYVCTNLDDFVDFVNAERIGGQS